MDTLVRHFASALSARGIRVNAVAPGVVETDDIGGVIAFRVSDEARWITGDTIHFDGGSTL